MLQIDRDPTLRELNVEARRQRILAAARQLITEGGMSALSMRKLALEAGLAHVRGQGGRLGDALVGLGHLKSHDLFRMLEHQFQQRFQEIFGWTSGWYEVLEGHDPPQDTIPLNADTIQLVTAGVRGQFDLGVLGRIFNGYLDQVVVIKHNPHITHHSLRFNSKELRLYTALETGVSIRSLIERMYASCQIEYDYIAGNNYRL